MGTKLVGWCSLLLQWTLASPITLMNVILKKLPRKFPSSQDKKGFPSNSKSNKNISWSSKKRDFRPRPFRRTIPAETRAWLLSDRSGSGRCPSATSGAPLISVDATTTSASSWSATSGSCSGSSANPSGYLSPRRHAGGSGSKTKSSLKRKVLISGFR